jgi:hypothetical protein
MATRKPKIGSKVKIRYSDQIGTVVSFDAESGYAVDWDRSGVIKGYDQEALYVIPASGPIQKPQPAPVRHYGRVRSFGGVRVSP